MESPKAKSQEKIQGTVDHLQASNPTTPAQTNTTPPSLAERVDKLESQTLFRNCQELATQTELAALMTQVPRLERELAQAYRTITQAAQEIRSMRDNFDLLMDKLEELNRTLDKNFALMNGQNMLN